MTNAPDDDGLPRYWCAGEAVQTRFLEAVSLLAPEVERFVVSAVDTGLSLPGAGAFEEDCRAFMREEEGHSRVHGHFNRRLAAQGIDPSQSLAPLRQAMTLAMRRLPRRTMLAMAAACEHLSAVLSLTYLRSARTSRFLPPRISRLFESHARDELGHRAVVFDLLKSTGGGGWVVRALALAAVGAAALWCTLRVTNDLLKHDTPRQRVTALRLAWRHGTLWPGLFLRGLASFLKPGFHPSQLPDR